ncbi:tRNA pseudouridine(38-40) synthase TruA [Zavarzinia sp. CC-PAN008]|uniref:tRNA pseudouridine(38-40) synthase TruA n=1 Tax=Zavarzinia sp. CC-PAN008 TaxID=3243332 RepID=UPI003F74A975
MPRYALVLEYDGTAFVGWQRQDNGPSVQAALERAIAGFSGETVVTTAAGRTDTGVHATGQVVHFDLVRDHAPRTVRDALNFHLRPDPVAVLQADRVADGFNARFDATARHYRYTILNRPAPPVLERGRVWHVPHALDAGLMAAGAARLEGRHDFTSFRAAQCQANSPLRTLYRLAVTRVGEVILVEASARSFLHHQVRNMVGTLKLVGEGKWSPDAVAKALAARDRAAAGPTAPPQGLVLTRVDYPPAGDGQG